MPVRFILHLLLLTSTVTLLSHAAGLGKFPALEKMAAAIVDVAKQMKAAAPPTTIAQSEPKPLPAEPPVELPLLTNNPIEAFLAASIKNALKESHPAEPRPQNIAIVFRKRSSAITDHVKAKVYQAVDLLKAQPDLKVHIRGFPDQPGVARRNSLLAASRAYVVKNELLMLGITIDRIHVESYVATPVNPNAIEKPALPEERKVELLFK